MWKLLKTLLKLSVAAGLIAYMVSTGRLDFSALKVFAQTPYVGVVAVALYAFAFVGLGSLRWHILMRGCGLRSEYRRTLQLQMIGQFFNTVMPGAVGGDLVKVFYVVRENPDKRSVAFLTVALDRLLGLTSLVFIGVIAVLLTFDTVWSMVTLRPVVYILAGVALAIACGITVALYPRKKEDSLQIWLAKRTFFGASTIRKLYGALLAFRQNPLPVFMAIGLGIAIQTGSIAYFAVLTSEITGATPEIGRLAAIIPLGVFLAAIPLAPAGIGVGHMAFDNLYTLAGWNGGANIFNAMLLSQLTLNFLGLIPYLLFRSKMPDLDEMQRSIADLEGKSTP